MFEIYRLLQFPRQYLNISVFSSLAQTQFSSQLITKLSAMTVGGLPVFSSG